MILSDVIRKIPGRPEFLLWAGAAGEDNRCEITRVSGFAVSGEEHITFFLPVPLFQILEPALRPGSKVSFLMASIRDFESYQVKGTYESFKVCTEEEIDAFRLKILKVTDILTEMGLNGNGILGFLMEKPCIAVTMFCTEVYEQTPRPGTGEKLNR